MRGRASFSVGERVIVNGIDITDSVAAMKYVEITGEIPILELALKCDPTLLEGEGVVIASDGVAPGTIIDFLDGLDPDYIEQRLLNLGFGVPVGEGILMILREVAGGQLRETAD